MIRTCRQRRSFLAAGALCLLSFGAAAESYPDKPIRLLVGFAPGGSTDVIARLYGEGLSRRLRQPVLVENVSGAAGDVATKQMLSRPADGYTLMWAASTQLMFSAAMQKQPRFDPITQFTPIAVSSGFPFIVTIPASLPADDLASFIAYARKNKGTLSYGSSGIGTGNHLAGEWFNLVAGTDFRHIPYRGDAASAVDLVSGTVQLDFLVPNVALPLIDAGKIKALAVTSSTRTKSLPGVPTMEEAGFPGFVAEIVNGLVGPARVPPNVVEMLNREINAIAEDPAVVKQLDGLGVFPVTRSAAEFGTMIRDGIQRWRTVVRDADIAQQE